MVGYVSNNNKLTTYYFLHLLYYCLSEVKHFVKQRDIKQESVIIVMQRPF